MSASKKPTVVHPVIAVIATLAKEIVALQGRVARSEERLAALYCDVHDSEGTNQILFEKRYQRMLSDKKRKKK